MSTYDDGEAFADDQPEDLVYLVSRARFSDDLAEQLQRQAVHYPGIDLGALVLDVARAVRPDHAIVIDKTAAHDAIRERLAELDPEARQILAHEILVLAQQHTDANLERIR